MPTTRSSRLELQTVVLLVDDQPIIAAAVQKMIAGHPSWRLHYCKDARLALAMAQELRPTVILQDLVMPEMDGLELVKLYRDDPDLRETPLIVLSSKEEATVKAHAFALGANDYLVKLPDPVEVVARIRHHSDGYKALQERNAAFEALAASERHLQEENRRAADYVRSLLPQPLTQGVATTEWRFVPSESLGGDAFGYHWLDRDRLAVYLLDVCGHGVGPALLGVSAMNVIQSNAIPGCDMGTPSAVLAGLNDLFPMERHHDMYFTLWYGILDVAKGRLTWSGGAHPPGLLLAPDGSMQELASQGIMVGAGLGMTYDQDQVPVPAGARLLLYSDGIYELQRPDGSMANLQDFVVGVPAALRQPMALDTLLDRARAVQQSANFKDDVSLLEVRYTP